MNIKSNYYGDVRFCFAFLTFVLTSAFTCAWRDFTVRVGETPLLWLQLAFWSERSNSLKQKVAGVRLRVVVFGRELFHHTVLPITTWHWNYKHPWRRKAFGWFLNRWSNLVWKFATRFVDRRYNAAGKLWREQCHQDYTNRTGRFVGANGNQLLEYR